VNFSVACAAFCTSLLAGCIAPHANVPIKNVPPVTATPATFTIVRRNNPLYIVADSFVTHYISLDGVMVATLETGQFTRFPVSEGHHTLATTWHVWDDMGGIGGFGAAVLFVSQNAHKKEIEVDCEAQREYFFTISREIPFSLKPYNEEKRTQFQQVERLEGKFVLEGKNYVPTGPSNSK